MAEMKGWGLQFWGEVENEVMNGKERERENG
ncbi:uncharacterized protein G2W53_008836 [Senna tora]|uniref:Uncharacterized protein n=1 Tax=Senna tora TaxID=362788 RepID=A0A834WX40_9FABA|nr:uncharacterized protein G2W53_008836 [Senna tora]